MSGLLLPKPEQLVDLVGHIGAIQLTMTGAFDEKISELKTAQAELAKFQGIVATVAEAQKIRDNATVFAEDTSRRCGEALAKAEQKLGEVIQREAVVTSREGAVGRRETATETRNKILDSRERSIITAQEAREGALADREVALKRNEEKCAAAASKLASDISAFNARLESLRA